MTANSRSEHGEAAVAVAAEYFDRDADAYDSYLRQERGTLRQEVALAHLLAVIPALSEPAPLRILDAGGGTGQLATRLAGMGHSVHLLDPSPRMLALARQNAAAAGAAVGERLTYIQASLEDIVASPI